MFLAAGSKSTAAARFSRFLFAAIFILIIILISLTPRAAARMLLSPSANGLHHHHHNHDHHHDNQEREKDNLFSKYFNGVKLPPPEVGGFADSMRRVPSCPDPLHN